MDVYAGTSHTNLDEYTDTADCDLDEHADSADANLTNTPVLPTATWTNTPIPPTATDTRMPTITPTHTWTPTSTTPPNAARVQARARDQRANLSGGAFTVNLTVENVANLAGFQTDLLFDPAIVSVNGVSLGAFLGSTGRAVARSGRRLTTPPARSRSARSRSEHNRAHPARACWRRLPSSPRRSG